MIFSNSTLFLKQVIIPLCSASWFTSCRCSLASWEGIHKRRKAIARKHLPEKDIESWNTSYLVNFDWEKDAVTKEDRMFGDTRNAFSHSIKITIHWPHSTQETLHFQFFMLPRPPELERTGVLSLQTQEVRSFLCSLFQQTNRMEGAILHPKLNPVRNDWNLGIEFKCTGSSFNTPETTVSWTILLELTQWKSPMRMPMMS